jgi:ketosteroid isomerase-like protein
MDELTAVRGAMDCLVSGALAPLLELLANDVEFEVASGGDVPGCRKDSGRQAVADYFAALGDLPAFWQMEYSAAGGRVIAWGEESFTVDGCGLEGESEFALVLDFHQGAVTRFMAIEDLSFMPGWEVPSAAVAGERPMVARSPGTLQQPVPAGGEVGVSGRPRARPAERVAAGAPA